MSKKNINSLTFQKMNHQEGDLANTPPLASEFFNASKLDSFQIYSLNTPTTLGATQVKTFLNFEDFFSRDPYSDFRRRVSPISQIFGKIDNSFDSDKILNASFSEGLSELTRAFEAKHGFDNQRDTKFSSGSLSLLNSKLRNRLTEIGGLNEINLSKSNGNELLLSATHVSACSCSACCAQQFNTSGLNESLSRTPLEAKVKSTGDIQLDAVLGGFKWGVNTISYSFYDDDIRNKYYGSERVSEVSEAIKTNVRKILKSFIEPFVDLKFVEVKDTQNSYGMIRYQLTDMNGYAYAYLPQGKDYNVGGYSDIFGDVHLSKRNDVNDGFNGFRSGIGSHGFSTIIHETLHALGLKHPGDYNGKGSGDPPFLPQAEDSTANSIMSYNFAGAEPSTPMHYDIKALQLLYGAKQHNQGQTTYVFDRTYGFSDGQQVWGSSSNATKVLLWDSGGEDTLDFSKLASNRSGYRFDLREGGFLSSQSDYNGATYKPRHGGGKTYRANDAGTVIAYDVTIENVINSSSNDTIFANKAANTFSGYGVGKKTGKDVIIGADQLDNLDLSAYKSADVTQTKRDQDLFLDLGGNGSITLKEYFAADQYNRINILLDGATPNPVDPSVDPPPATTTQVSFQQGVNGFNGTVDTYFYTNSSSSHAATTTLRTDGKTRSGGVEQVLLRFEDIFGKGSGQIASNAQIKSATLQLDVTNKGDSLELHRMLQNWSDTDTWGSLGNGIQTNDVEAASKADVVTGPMSVGLHTVDVTASLQAWQANSSGNFGWALLPTGSDGVYFNSAEGITAPRLVVEYTVAPDLVPSDPGPTDPGPIDKTLVGKAGDDQLVGAGGNDKIKGLAGNDTLDGQAGSDKLWGGAGIDTINGGDGSDIIHGGGGNDIIDGGDGNDTINGGDGIDVLTGGLGVDTFVYERINKHNKGDTVTDFDLNKDKFDLSAIFSDAKYGSANPFGEYIQIVGSGTDAQVKVDTLGDTGNEFKTLATLTGVDAMSLNTSQFVV